jgi:hypothetical protein
MDQIMGDAQRTIETPGGKRKFPDAPHSTYYLMRAELFGEDLDSRSTEEVVKALRINTDRQREIHEGIQASRSNSPDGQE